MQITSAAFDPEASIPRDYTCDGGNQSPPLSWQGVPEATQSLALIVDDPDAPGRTFVHWVLYNLPPDQSSLSAAQPTSPTLLWGGIQGRNDFRAIGYGGPCPPQGRHRYDFKLYALDQRLTLEPGATKDQVVEAMDGHVLATAELIGYYNRS